MPSLCILSIIPGYANLSFFSVSNTATKEKAIPTIQSNHPPCYFPSPDPHVLLVYLLLTLMYSHRPSCVLDPSIGCLHWLFSSSSSTLSPDICISAWLISLPPSKMRPNSTSAFSMRKCLFHALQMSLICAIFFFFRCITLANFYPDYYVHWCVSPS